MLVVERKKEEGASSFSFELTSNPFLPSKPPAPQIWWYSAIDRIHRFVSRSSESSKEDQSQQLPLDARPPLFAPSRLNSSTNLVSDGSTLLSQSNLSQFKSSSSSG